jgi:hypothetical protein
MNDQELQEALRATFTAHAETITTGPQWQADEQPDRPRRRHGARLWVPMAAAAAAAGLVAVTGILTTGPAAPTPEVPAGMQAVDALGVEIFVPADFRVGNCGPKTVRLPVAPTDPCAPSPLGQWTHVEISTERLSPGGRCLAEVALDDETTCVSTTPLSGTGVQPGARFVASWARHAVSILVSTSDENLGLEILRSAHAVDVNRHGCAAKRDPMAVAGTTSDGKLFPGDVSPTSAGVCWYVGNRLGASTTLDATRATALTTRSDQTPRLFKPDPTARCTELAKHDGVLIHAQYDTGPVDAVIYLTRCLVPPLTSADSDFVQQLPRLTGLPTEVDFESQ